jgi:uncharacterized protein (TIGR02284 family)
MIGMASALLNEDMSLTDTFKTTPRSTLKNLVHTLRDGQEGFRKASEDVKNTRLKDVFSRLSLQRAKFAGELEAELLTLGEEDPQNEGSTVAGAVHRGWMDLKAALTSNDEHAVLAEAERGEDSAVKEYKEALETELPEPIRKIVSKQAVDIKRAHDEVKTLRDAAKR